MDRAKMINELISHYTGGSKTKFARKLGIKPQTINTWQTRNTFDADLIYSKCDGVSGDWLFSGEGEMLKTNINYVGDNNSGNVNQNSGAGNITNTSYYRESPECAEKNMEQDERSGERADVVMHKMLDIVIDRFDAIEKEIAERNKLHGRLLEIIQQKDEQIGKLIDKIK